MKGTLTTTKYNSRLEFERNQPYAIEVVHNDFTNIGLEWIWRRLVGLEVDLLSGAAIGVGNGGGVFTAGEMGLQGSEVELAGLDAGFPVIAGSKITFQSTFGERMASFDWLERGVFTPGGVLLDRAVGDQGRKVLGAVWTVMAELELARS